MFSKFSEIKTVNVNRKGVVHKLRKVFKMGEGSRISPKSGERVVPTNLTSFPPNKSHFNFSFFQKNSLKKKKNRLNNCKGNIGKCNISNQVCFSSQKISGISIRAHRKGTRASLKRPIPTTENVSKWNGKPRVGVHIVKKRKTQKLTHTKASPRSLEG